MSLAVLLENKLGLENDVAAVSRLSKSDLPVANKLFVFGDCSNSDLVCVVLENREVVVVEESNANCCWGASGALVRMELVLADADLSSLLFLIGESNRLLDVVAFGGSKRLVGFVSLGGMALSPFLFGSFALLLVLVTLSSLKPKVTFGLLSNIDLYSFCSELLKPNKGLFDSCEVVSFCCSCGFFSLENPNETLL